MFNITSLTCFIAGGLTPLLPVRHPARQKNSCSNVARVPLCMGRRSDKIKNRKDSQTRARTKVFARIGKMITIAAKAGGSDLMINKALADALDVARAASFPKETMEKAIARATSTDQADFKESSFEVYGHGGVGIFVDVLTDNPNRAAADIRTVVNKNKMKIGSPGSVAFNFERMGVIRINADHVSDADELLLAASEAGAEECDIDPFNPEQYLISTKLEDLKTTREALTEAGYSIDFFQPEMIPKTITDVSESDFDLNLRAIEQLEDLDDVDSVFSNIAPPKD